MKILGGALLVLSLALNIFLWNRLAKRGNDVKSAQTSTHEVDGLQRQEVQANRRSVSDISDAKERELARLRNEAGQLRKQVREADSLRTQAAEAAQLRARLSAATQNLARAESELAEAVKLSPEQLQQLKEEAESIRCVNNLKQIGLAARIWANDHNDVFPPDFISMKDELETPKILFCPADGAAIRVTAWWQVNPSSISYRFLNPNGNYSDATKLLTRCPIHGHEGYSDGRVNRQ